MTKEKAVKAADIIEGLEKLKECAKAYSGNGENKTKLEVFFNFSYKSGTLYRIIINPKWNQHFIDTIKKIIKSEEKMLSDL